MTTSAMSVSSARRISVAPTLVIVFLVVGLRGGHRSRRQAPEQTRSRRPRPWTRWPWARLAAVRPNQTLDKATTGHYGLACEV